MGLGKTVEIVALVLATLAQPAGCRCPARARRLEGDIIVVPATLLCVDGQGKAPATVRCSAPSIPMSSRSRATAAVKAAVKEPAKHDIVIATYKTLEKCTTALPSICWRRVVLDEMQEVRSSTTELAKKCERLVSPRRWMVSGTPLYDKISDLQGELYFLRVSPFGAGHDDGFWNHCVGRPWEAKEEAALDALQVLLGAVMLRRSKTQTYLDGTPILELPTRSIVRAPVALDGSEQAAYAYLEQLVVSEVKRTRALAAGVGDNPLVAADAEGAARVRLLRSASGCSASPPSRSTSSAAAGASASPTTATWARWIRSRARTTRRGASARRGIGQATEAELNEVAIQRMSAGMAISQLAALDRSANDAQHLDRMHNAQHRGDMVRHANTTQRVHQRTGTTPSTRSRRRSRRRASGATASKIWSTRRATPPRSAAGTGRSSA